jgi:shikimate dehydrogenase
MRPDTALLIPFPVEPTSRSFLCGLLGSGIKKSRSPDIHETEAAALGLRLVYRIIDFESLGLGTEALPDILRAAERLGFDGLNVTHPYKQQIIPLLDAISEEARGIGAVNTVVFSDGKRIGHNTDASGFGGCFERGLPGAALNRIVQIGAGGAGAATAHSLLGRGAGCIGLYDTDVAHAERLAANLVACFGQGRAYVISDLAAAMQEADGLVQTSPVGMTSHPGLPIPIALLRPEMWVIDIIYFPLVTELLAAARAIGCQTVCGGAMVVLQAADAFTHFTGAKPDTERMLRHFVETS